MRRRRRRRCGWCAAGLPLGMPAAALAVVPMAPKCSLPSCACCCACCRACRDNKAETKEDQAFDVLTRELVFEAKAKPGERTLTAEELAELERQRLEALEAARKRRQSEDAGSEGEGEDGGAPAAPVPAGGYAARRAKRKRAEQRADRLGGTSGDALEDDWASGSDSGALAGRRESGWQGFAGWDLA